MVPANVIRWKPLVVEIVAQCPPLVVNEPLAIIWSESCGDPTAVNPGDPSAGLMQLTATIAEYYGGIKCVTFEELKAKLFDPRTNVMIGCKFLADLKKKHGATNPLTDPDCAWVAAYNEGEGNLRRRRPDPAYVSAFNCHLAELNALIVSTATTSSGGAS